MTLKDFSRKVDYQAYLDEINKLPINEDIKNKIAEINQRYGINSNSLFKNKKYKFVKTDDKNKKVYDINRFFPIFSPLSFMNIWDNDYYDNVNVGIDTETEKEWSNLSKEIDENVKDTEGIQPSSYAQYSSSFTSYDENGKKRTHSVRQVDKIIDGKRYSSKSNRVVNGDEYEEEIFLPDGRKAIKTNKQNQLPNK